MRIATWYDAVEGYSAAMTLKAANDTSKYLEVPVKVFGTSRMSH